MPHLHKRSDNIIAYFPLVVGREMSEEAFTDLDGDGAPEGEWAYSIAELPVGETLIEFSIAFSADGTVGTVNGHMFDVDPGTYENLTLRYQVTRGGATETLEIPVPRLVVE